MKELVLEELEAEAGKLEKHVEDDFGTGKFAEYQKCLWNLMEKPDTSRSNKYHFTKTLFGNFRTAKAVSFISFLFVLVSTIGMTLNTIPSVQYTDPQAEWMMDFLGIKS